MKASEYNIFVPFQNKYILYNTMCDSISIVDEELKGKIENDPNDIDMEYVEKLSQSDIGALVKDEVDELSVAKCRYYEEKYDTRLSGFTIITTYACNLKCPYCYEGRGEVLNTSMNKDIMDRTEWFIKSVAERNNSKAINLFLYGGEPLLNWKVCKELPRRIDEWCRETGRKLVLGMTTNGVLLNEERIDELKSHNLRYVQITIDGPKWLHDKKRIFKDGRPTYDIIVDNIKKLKEKGVHFTIRISVDKESLTCMEETVDELRSLSLDNNFYFGFINDRTQYCKDWSCLTLDDLWENLPRLASMAMKKGVKYYNIRPKHQPHPCGSTSYSSFAIDPLGDVYKCWEFAGQKEHRVGYLDEKGNLIREYPYYDTMARDPFSLEKCRDCILLPNCGGGCMAEAFFRYKKYNAPGCAITPELVSKQLEAYVKLRYNEDKV
jgi:uncharacterized protein